MSDSDNSASVTGRLNMEPHAEELTRRLSEIDLTAQTTKDTLPEFAKAKYTNEELLSLRPGNQDGAADTPDSFLDGVHTPASPPAPPPGTPTIKLNCEVKVDDEAHELGALMMGDGAKKKKKKSKSKSGTEKIPSTGFEEFYADPPVTPDEHEEESDLYAPERPFHERVQTCVQRYRARRKLDEHRALIITKYLQLGGVEAATTKSFTGGLDKETVENSTAAEIAAIQATDFVRAGALNARYYDPLKPEGWVVDFEGVAKGFLSHTAPRRIGDSDNNVRQFCAVIKNFLNYVLTHAVCPEYTDDVLAARKICDLAEREHFDIAVVQRMLPGDFAVAASTLYGGHHSEMLEAAKSPWATMTTTSAMSVMNARRIFKTGIALAGTDDMYNKLSAEEVHIVKTEKRYLQIVGMKYPSAESIAEFAAILNTTGEPGFIKALGVLECEAWEGPCVDEEDRTDDGEEDATIVDAPIETFWLEHTILEKVFVGMKMEVQVQELNIGVKFFDQVAGVYCSFYTYLPNEKMAYWKEPRLNSRPAPSEDDPDAEEGAMVGDMEKEMEDDEKLGKKLIKADLEPVIEATEVATEE